MQKKVMALCLRVQFFWPSLYIIIFSNLNSNYNFKIELLGSASDQVSFHKYLGVIINDKSSWHQYTAIVTAKLLKLCGLLYN